ncbi:MAG: hypothetical protein ACFCVE_03675 [Phycisphaerae bacterium]
MAEHRSTGVVHHPHGVRHVHRPRRHGVAEMLVLWFLVLAGGAAISLHGLAMGIAHGLRAKAEAQLAAKGEPTDPAVFDHPVPPEHDLALRPPEVMAGYEDFEGDSADPAEAGALAAHVAAERERIAEVRLLLDDPRSDVSVRLRPPLMDSLIGGEITSSFLITRLLHTAAVQAAREDDGASAAADVGRMLRLAELTRRRPLLVNELVASGIDAAASNTALHPEVTAALPEDERLALARRFAERAGEPMSDRWLAVEMMVGTDMLDNVSTLYAAVRLWRFQESPLAVRLLLLHHLKPWIDYEVAQLMNYYLELRPLLMSVEDVSTVPTAMESFQAGPLPPGDRGLYLRWVTPSWDRAVVTMLSGQTQAAVTATAQAAVAFEKQHGRWPARLEDLVPAYLPELPRDRLADDANVSLRLEGDRLLIWSVGNDGKNDAADETVPPGDRHERRSTPGKPNWRAKDYVVTLRRS